MEKFRHFKIDGKGRLIFGGKDIETLINEYGTPTYFYDVDFIETIAQSYKKAYEITKVNGAPSYASKAFSAKEIYRIINRLGLHCDVVSGGELYTALSVGFPAERIFFHGNNKTSEELNFAVKNSVGIIVVDSFEEVEELSAIAEKNSKIQKVMVRVNPGIEA
ncbi:MAG: diaminopimelate decarboxylase, partial [Clostridia bacterium]|nr:diaminopimelate decarboxylase [Clostridia bacterium]